MPNPFSMWRQVSNFLRQNYSAISKTPSPSKSEKSLNTADQFLKSLELYLVSD